MDTNHMNDDWLESHIRAASARTTSPQFRQNVLRSIELQRMETSKRMRRMATVVLWTGVTVFTIAIVCLIVLSPESQTVRISLSDSSFMLPAGIILASMLSLATWEWLDRYV